jgi:TetR/AcrR family transcriptional regulator, regulator of biofilm formation and stress response
VYPRLESGDRLSIRLTPLALSVDLGAARVERCLEAAGGIPQRVGLFVVELHQRHGSLAGVGEAQLGDRLAADPDGDLDPGAGEKLASPGPGGDDDRAAAPAAALGLHHDSIVLLGERKRRLAPVQPGAGRPGEPEERAVGALGVYYARLRLPEDWPPVVHVHPQVSAGALGGDQLGLLACRFERAELALCELADAEGAGGLQQAHAARPLDPSPELERAQSHLQVLRVGKGRGGVDPSAPLARAGGGEQGPALHKVNAQAATGGVERSGRSDDAAADHQQVAFGDLFARGGHFVYDCTVQMYTSPVEQTERTGAASAFGDGRRTRGTERRDLLLQTTLRLIAEDGIDAVSHRAVAQAAGVPLGSTTYWFDSRQAMLEESLEHFVRSEIGALHDRLAGLRGASLSRRRLVDELTALLLPQLEEDRWRTVAQYTLLQEASRNAALRPLCREWTEAWDAELEAVFASLGVPDPELEARMFLAMLDGLLLAQLAAPDEDVERELIRPALERWFRRLSARDDDAPERS